MITNRRGAKALEKIAQAQERLANAEEKMYGAFRDLLDQESKNAKKPARSPAGARSTIRPEPPKTK
jgi:hypothetical protein